MAETNEESVDTNDSCPVTQPPRNPPSRRGPFPVRILVAMIGLYGSHRASSQLQSVDSDELHGLWSDRLSDPVNERTANTIGRAYDGAVERGLRVEAKAIGYLQVIAISFAIIALVASTDSIWLRALCLGSTFYLAAAVWGAVDVLRVRPRPQLLAQDAVSPSHGLVEAVVAAQVMEHDHVRASNYASGACRDLVVGGALAVAALVLVALGVGRSTLAPTVVVPQSPAITEPGGATTTAP